MCARPSNNDERREKKQEMGMRRAFSSEIYIEREKKDINSRNSFEEEIFFLHLPTRK